MAFIEMNEEQKQHIALDKDSAIILENDMAAFGVEKRSTFINKIITNFRYEAESSLQLSSERYAYKLRNELEENPFPSPITEAQQEIMIDHMCDLHTKKNKESYLLNNSDKYTSFKIRLQNENYEYLLEECEEDKHYNATGMGAYLNALIKEYCSKNYIEREKIYAKDVFQTAQNAIDTKRFLSIEINGVKKKIKPCEIVADPLSMYHYLIGYELLSSSQKDIKSFSCRISRITKIKQLREKFFIDKDDSKILYAELQIKGAQFLSDDAGLFAVKLTEEGKNLFKRILHLRPNFIEVKHPNAEDVDEDYPALYFLCCTALQVNYYLPKFGADAVIQPPSHYEHYIKDLAPQIEAKLQQNVSDENIQKWDTVSKELREKFAQKYKKAHQAYTK